MDKHSRNSSVWIHIFKRILPSPFTIAIVLTILTMLIALIFTQPQEISVFHYFIQLCNSWENGLWDNSGGGLYFAFQMMLILVLGHILALTPLIDRIIQSLLKYCKSTASSVIIVALGSMTLGLINWGLGLIFGAIIARKVGEKFAYEQKTLNYGLVGAAGYSSMMVWHGGLSGSATTKSMEWGHIPEMMKQAQLPGNYPSQIPFEATIGSSLNIIVTISCLLFIPLILFWVSKKLKQEQIPHFSENFKTPNASTSLKIQGAERLDYSNLLGICLGGFILLFGIAKAVQYEGASQLGFIQLNFINFIFLGLSLLLHKNIQNFSNALQTAIGDVSGILIQFPFYFGILAIMQNSGLILLFSNSITQISTGETLPLFTFISAGFINLFVPSGGGQWAIQGPIIIETAQQLGASIPKTILAMAYGDQWTNMLQPFWALPLLGITKLKPQQLLPYTFIVFLIGFVIFSAALFFL